MSSMLDFWLFAAVLPAIQPRWGLRASPPSFPRVGWQPGQRLNLSIFSGVNTAVMAGADQ
jgi:hypothetical protein